MLQARLKNYKAENSVPSVILLTSVPNLKMLFLLQTNLTMAFSEAECDFYYRWLLKMPPNWPM